MTLTPDYGETLITSEERDALVPAIRDVLSEPIMNGEWPRGISYRSSLTAVS